MNTEHTLRLRYIEYGLNESRKRLSNSLVKHMSMSINASLSEVIFWINAADEWHFKNRNENKVYLNKRKSVSGGQCLLGLKFVYNAVKHDMDFVKTVTSAEVKPLANNSNYFIEDYSSGTKWIKAEGIRNKDFTDRNRQRRYVEQRKDYRRYLENRDVIETIDSAISFIHSVNGEYFFEQKNLT